MKKYLLPFILLFIIGKASASSSPVPILFFTASWCGPCKSMEAQLPSITDKFASKITLQKINVDNDKEMAQQYNLKSIPVTIVAGKIFVGATVPISHIESAIRQAIDNG